MGVDYSLTDYTRDEDLIVCRHVYVSRFESLVFPQLPEQFSPSIFDIERSAYIDIDEGPVVPADLPRAVDMATSFDQLAAIVRVLETKSGSAPDTLDARALEIFSCKALEHWGDYCRANPESRILISLW